MVERVAPAGASGPITGLLIFALLFAAEAVLANSESLPESADGKPKLTSVSA